MKALPLHLELAASHWGAYRVLRDGQGRPRGLGPLPEDPDPSPIGIAMWDAYASDLRVQRPAIREGWLRYRGARDTGVGRGREPFVEVDWDEALDLVAGTLDQVRATCGNEAIFGGSYGWSSAGRFHHAQSQVHRFLNCLGGYVRHMDTYSLAAGRVLMPHVVATMEQLMAHQDDWSVLAAHTKLFVSFGGVPLKNAQVGAGGASHHHARRGLDTLAAAGCRFVNFSPVRDDLHLPDTAREWVAVRPNTDVAVMLALTTEVVRAGLQDRAFLASHCTGFERWSDYLLGRVDGQVKDAEWAEPICGIPAPRLREIALRMAETRCLVNVAWSLQRADHGEQAFWAALGLAAVLGQIGLPGGGFAVAYGPVNNTGSPGRLLPGPTLPQGQNPVSAFIPVARIADMLLDPGARFTYNGRSLQYPRIELIYWAGGNPFHHHQDLHRLARAWTRPRTIVVHEQFWNAHARMADIVLPATSNLERNDIGHATRDAFLVAMKAIAPAPGVARDDYAIFCDLSRRLGTHSVFSEGRDERAWLNHLYEESSKAMAAQGVELPSFEEFWDAGGVRLPANDRPVRQLDLFRQDPLKHPLATPSGRIELFSERLDGFGSSGCLGHPAWFEPAEWLGSPRSRRYPLHLLSDQPWTKLHSQLDHSALSRSSKVAGREPVRLHPDDARQRGVVAGDVVRIFNDRGACLAGVVLDDGLLPGVVRLSTGAWWDPDCPGDPTSLDVHGNPNTLTRDAGSSELGQGCTAQTCLVQLEKYHAEPPPLRINRPPRFVTRNDVS